MLFLSIICDSCLYEQDYDPAYQFQICDNCGNTINLDSRDTAEPAHTNDPLRCTCFEWEDDEECPVHGKTTETANQCPECGCAYMQKRPSAPDTDWVCARCNEPVKFD